MQECHLSHTYIHCITHITSNIIEHQHSNTGTAREIKSAAHAAASAVANIKAEEKRESRLVGAAAREACEGCGMNTAEAARTGAEIAMTSVLAANAQDNEDSEMYDPHKAASGAGLDESSAVRFCSRIVSLTMFLNVGH